MGNEIYPLPLAFITYFIHICSKSIFFKEYGYTKHVELSGSFFMPQFLHLSGRIRICLPKKLTLRLFPVIPKEIFFKARNKRYLDFNDYTGTVYV